MGMHRCGKCGLYPDSGLGCGEPEHPVEPYASMEEKRQVNHSLQTYGHAFIHAYLDNDGKPIRRVVTPERIFLDGRRMA